MKFEQAQISRKLAQATASHRKLAVKRGHKRAQAKNVRWLASPFDKGLNLLSRLRCQLVYSLSRFVITQYIF